MYFITLIQNHYEDDSIIKYLNKLFTVGYNLSSKKWTLQLIINYYLVKTASAVSSFSSCTFNASGGEESHADEEIAHIPWSFNQGSEVTFHSSRHHINEVINSEWIKSGKWVGT